MVVRDRTKLPPLSVCRSILPRAFHENRSASAREPESTYGGQGQNRTRRGTGRHGDFQSFIRFSALVNSMTY